MKQHIALVAAVFAAMLSIAPTPSSAAPDKNRLMLSVTLDSIYNRHFQVIIPVTIGKSFKVVSDNGDVTNTISGTIGVPVDGKYPAPIFVEERASEVSNVNGTTQFRLEIDKAQGVGFVSSFVFMRTVKITKISD